MNPTRSWLAPALAVLAFAPAALTPLVARAQQPAATEGNGETGEKGETVATTRFVEACTTGDWEKAERFFRELVDGWPAYRQDSAYVYKHCVVLSKLGTATRKSEAVDELQALLERDRENIQAMYLLAQLKAQSDKAPAKEEAKDLLLNAARHGFYTLREIMSSKDETWKYLRNDPRFILAAMKAIQEFNPADMQGARNPFELPARFVIPPTGRDGPEGRVALTPAKLAALEARVEAIFVDLERFSREQKLEELMAKLAEIDQIMRDHKGPGRDKVQEMLDRWEKRLDGWKEIRLTIKLDKYVDEGNELLKDMVKAKQAERYDDVFALFASVQKLVTTMQHEEREEFVRTAAAIRVRGTALQDEARKLKRIKELDLEVTGIVLDPRPEGHNRAIIVYDDPDKRGRIYEESDEIRTRDDRRVDGLRIVRIAEGSIKFRYDDTEFSRLIKAP